MIKRIPNKLGLSLRVQLNRKKLDQISSMKIKLNEENSVQVKLICLLCSLPSAKQMTMTNKQITFTQRFSLTVNFSPSFFLSVLSVLKASS